MPEEKQPTGRLYGVGLGPGDPELLTLKAQRVLAHVPVIFVPRKSERSQGLAEAIIGNLAPGLKAKCVGLVLPMHRDQAKLRECWRQAAATVWQHLSGGQDAALVNEGDPLLYGTFIHVLRALQENHPEVQAEVVPGVSSLNAAAARAVVPLASNHENIAVISGDQEELVLRNALENFATVVFLKVNTVFDRLAGILEETGRNGGAVYVRRCGTPQEEIVRDIGQLKGEKLDYFSLLIVRQ